MQSILVIPFNSQTLKTTFIRMALFFLTLVFSSYLFGQQALPDLTTKSLKEIKGIAKNALRLGDTYTALFYYQEWANRKEEDPALAYQVASLYQEARDYKEAERWYLKSKKMKSDNNPLLLYHLAEVQMSQGKYVEAKKNLSTFKKLASDLKDPSYKKLTKAALLSCDFALGYRDSTSTVVIDHLDESINKAHAEFSPIVMDDNTLIYGSLKENGVNYYDVAMHDSMKIPLRKFYLAHKKGKEWVSEGELKGPFNVEGQEIGNGALSSDGKRLYFTRCKKNWMNKVICELYYSDLKNGEWQPAIRMNDLINMPNYTTTQPAVGKESKKNREVIYFVSDRPGGKGGWDIWYTEYDQRKDRYKSPRNAGSKVNTVGTEFTPYYDIPTHKLYFSSNARVGFGGLDVYQVDGEKSRWEVAQNMGIATNSPADDFDFTLSKDKKGGFLVTNRVGGVALLNPTCCDDIYAFKFTKYIEINLKGIVNSEGEPLSNYNLNIYINFDEGVSDEIKEVKERYLAQQLEINGSKFAVQLEEGYDYTIEATKDGYLRGSVDVSTRTINESTTLTTSIELPKLSEQPMVLKGILYEFDSPDLTTSAKTVIDTTLYKILIQNPDIIVQISSHTDSKGTESYNLKLSKKRAQSVVKYLVKRGIDQKRLQYKGYGESRPIAPNKNEDGTDNPEGRKLNRRTDFQIVGKLKQKVIEEDW